MILVNFKTYNPATGEKARKLAKHCIEASEETGVEIVIAPEPQDLLRVKDMDIEVFSQHVDPIEPGSHTGHILPEAVNQAGAEGTLINHSERRLEKDRIAETVDRAKEVGMTTVICAQDPEECGELSQLKPDYIAFEPPELIGGDVSVSEARPELIEEAVEKSSVPVLTGAGIHSTKDVEKSIELGCEGVLVASGVIKNGSPYKAVKELCEGVKE